MQKINYDREQQKKLKKFIEKAIKPKVFIHSCCAPCSTYVLEKLYKIMDITIYFYNPNIHPKKEYEFRKEVQKKFIDDFNEHYDGANIQFLAGLYEPQVFFDKTKGYEDEPERTGTRCAFCYELRLEAVAKKAKELQYDYFASALTLSPKKDSQKINQLGFEIEKMYGIAYLPSDFKKNNGYQRSIELCNLFDVYRQCYCGCVFAAKQQGINFKEILRKRHEFSDKE